jgi:hypothetical protein
MRMPLTADVFTLQRKRDQSFLDCNLEHKLDIALQLMIPSWIYPFLSGAYYLSPLIIYLRVILTVNMWMLEF